MVNKYRLLTRMDLDGIVCAILFKELDLVDEIKFVHPKDMQDKKISVTSKDITTNLPYVEGVHLAFDHHESEINRTKEDEPDNFIVLSAHSTARVIFEYYGGSNAFPNISEDMLIAVDKADSAQFNRAEILNPTGWVLLNFILDPRTGLGRFGEFTINNYDLALEIVNNAAGKSVGNILNLPNVKERVDIYNFYNGKFQEQLTKCAEIYGKLVVLDLRDEETIFYGNRFIVYELFKECNISMHVMWGKDKANTVFSLGKSILNKTSQVNIADIVSKYGGGGHAAAGGCQISNEDAEKVKSEIIEIIVNW